MGSTAHNYGPGGLCFFFFFFERNPFGGRCLTSLDLVTRISREEGRGQEGGGGRVERGHQGVWEGVAHGGVGGLVPYAQHCGKHSPELYLALFPFRIFSPTVYV